MLKRKHRGRISSHREIFISNNISQNVFVFTVGGNVCGRTFETRMCIQATYIGHFLGKRKTAINQG